MPSTDETIVMMRSEMRPLLETALEGVLTKARSVLDEAEQRHTNSLAEIDELLAKGLAEVDKERTMALAEVEARREELSKEVATMLTHQAKQQGRVELNIGGHRFQTSVQTLRRVPHTFFDAYFSGRYAQDVCNDGSIFVDRDGEHFGHVLEYMRDGVVSVAEPGARPSVSLLRALKREFGFYCIELCAEEATEEAEMAYIVGGIGSSGNMTSVERYDATSGQWSAGVDMGTTRWLFGACVVSGDVYVTGGIGVDHNPLSSVEKYTPSTGTWSEVAPLPTARSHHAAVAVGSNMYVLGGSINGPTASVLKFDSLQGTWIEVAPMPGARTNFGSCAIGRDIFVFGGSGHPDPRTKTFVFKLNTERDVWSSLAPMPQASDHHSASQLDGLVYLVGAGATKREVLSFDPVSAEWRTLARTLRSRAAGSASFVMRGCLYVAGGSPFLSSVDRYDKATDTWTAVADMLEGRAYFRAVTIRSTGPAEEQDLFDSLIAQASSPRS
jgi:N-acetylneuraminic acid mutarotase